MHLSSKSEWIPPDRLALCAGSETVRLVGEVRWCIFIEQVVHF